MHPLFAPFPPPSIHPSFAPGYLKAQRVRAQRVALGTLLALGDRQSFSLLVLLYRAAKKGVFGWFYKRMHPFKLGPIVTNA
jgi:hypothetical protein